MVTLNKEIKAQSNSEIKRVDVFSLIQEWVDEKKVGNVQINFFKGGISSVKVEETLKTSEELVVGVNTKNLKRLRR